ncbi:MAG: hypothetical protein JXB88_05990 [Spirochaetales bacterium]|nr:hypothetical protein [Spirochaetales bacterium]
MPKEIISHKPELSKERLFEIFQNHFSGKYEVYESRLLGTDFVVKKSAWTGVSVRLIQKKDKTMIYYSAFAPSAAVRIFFMGLIPMLICYATVWKEIQNEIKEFIESAQEFH